MTVGRLHFRFWSLDFLVILSFMNRKEPLIHDHAARR